MGRVDLVLGWISAVGGALALLVVVLTGEWLGLGTLLGAVLVANAVVRLRLARSDGERGRRA